MPNDNWSLQLLFRCWTIDFIELLKAALTFVLSSPILTHCSQVLKSIKKTFSRRKCSPDVMHMLKNFTSTLFDLSISKLWVHKAFIFSRPVSLDPSFTIANISIVISSQVRFKWRHYCTIQDTSHFCSAVCETLCNFWVQKHFFIQLGHAIRQKDKKGYVTL